MLQITDLTREKYNELRNMAYKGEKQAKVLRKLMLDVLAEAYEIEEYIHPVYFERAQRLLDYATHNILALTLEKEGYFND